MAIETVIKLSRDLHKLTGVKTTPATATTLAHSRKRDCVPHRIELSLLDARDTTASTTTTTIASGVRGSRHPLAAEERLKV